jgi:F-type H+-transporting ATPase subunit b
MMRFWTWVSAVIATGLIWAGDIGVMAAETAANGKDKQAGLPQFNTDTYTSQVFWLAVAFIVTYFLMSQFALPQIARILAERDDRIAGDLDRAAELRRETKQVQSSYEETLSSAQTNARQLIAEKTEKMADKHQKELSKLADRLRKKMDQAEDRITNKKEEALESVNQLASEMTEQVLQHVIKLEHTDLKAQEAVNDVIQSKVSKEKAA